MRIGYDAKRLFSNETGLGNYSRSLVASIRQKFEEPEVHLYSPQLTENERSLLFLNAEKFRLHQPERGSKSSWRNRRIVRDLKRDKIEIYHGLSNELPVRIDRTQIKTVVTIHDVLFKRFPQDFPLIDRLIYQRKWKRSCRMADAIIAVSESTKEDLFKYYNVPAKKVEVIPPLIDQPYHTLQSVESLEQTRKRFSLPERFILFVGTVSARKNIRQLMEGYAELSPELQIPIVVIGKGKKYKYKVEQFVEKQSWADQVRWMDEFVPSDDLRNIYQLAEVFVYPSFCEGFGIPVVEALLSKTPVITSSTTSLPESAGPDSKLIHPSHISEMTDALTAVLGNADLRTKMSEEGFKYAQRFIDGRAEQKVMEIYQRVLKG